MSRLRAHAVPRWRFVAGLLSLVLLMGTVEIHRHSAASESASLGQEARFNPAASHPNQPRHIEAGAEADRPACPACLHNLATRGVHLARTATLSIETPSCFLPDVASSHPGGPSAHRAQGRAPPLV